MSSASPRSSGAPSIDALLADTRPPKGIHAVVTIDRHDLVPSIRTTGNDASAEFYELGSLTKTLTATILARQVVDGEVTLDRTVGAILGQGAGGAAEVTLGQLATHTSGLPRLPANVITVPWWPRDPYRFYRRARIDRALIRLEAPAPGQFEYSNFGYFLLGICMERIVGAPLDVALRDLIFEPVGMTTARCQPCDPAGLLRGNGHWLTAGRRMTQHLPGAGGVDGTIHDLASWLRANLEPDTTPLAATVRLAHEVHARTDGSAIGLGWMHRGAVRWHNGGTGGFHSMAAIGSDSAAGALAAHGVSKTFSLDQKMLDALSLDDGDS